MSGGRFDRTVITLGQLRTMGHGLGISRMERMTRAELVKAIVEAEKDAMRKLGQEAMAKMVEGRA